MIQRRPRRIVLAAVAAFLACPAVAAAQDAEALAKQTQNPVANLISLPMQANWDFGLGDRDATATLFNVQPVMPFGLNPHTNVILRVIMPLTSQPGPDAARINGLGDVVATAFFSPTRASRLTWGAGPVLLLPVATDNALGSEKFGIGPSVVALAQPGKWTAGVLFNQIWSTSGANDRSDVSQALFQEFVYYNLGDGLSAGVTLEASANWKADEVWTAPLIFSVSKVTQLGRRPTSFSVGAGPTFGPEGGATWRFRFVATFLFPR